MHEASAFSPPRDTGVDKSFTALENSNSEDYTPSSSITIGNGERYPALMDEAYDDWGNPRLKAPPPNRRGALMLKPRLLLFFIVVIFLLLVPGSWVYRDRLDELWAQEDQHPTKALVVASYVNQSVSWLDEIPTECVTQLLSTVRLPLLTCKSIVGYHTGTSSMIPSPQMGSRYLAIKAAKQWRI